jgi:hypothetical protein
MTDETEYTCWKCDKTAQLSNKKDAPFCCGKRMQPMKTCVKDTSSAEHSRNTDDDEPCDDN